MGCLHYEDYVCPLHQLWRQRIVGIVIGARRTALDSRMVTKHLLGSWASAPILTTHEEDSHYIFLGADRFCPIAAVGFVDAWRPLLTLYSRQVDLIETKLHCAAMVGAFPMHMPSE